MLCRTGKLSVALVPHPPLRGPPSPRGRFFGVWESGFGRAMHAPTHRIGVRGWRLSIRFGGGSCRWAYCSGDPFGFLYCAGADGASGGAGSGSGIDRCLPDMPVSAAPPDLLVASQGDFFRGQFAIHRLVPLVCQLRPQSRQIIKARKDFFAGTVRAAAALFLGSGKRHCLPAMAQAAFPPDLFMGTRKDRRWFNCVLLPIPLGCKLWVQGFQVGFPRNHHSAGAIGTACAGHGDAVDRRFPAMALFTLPPDLSVTSDGQLSGFQRRVSGNVPSDCYIVQ